MENKELRASSTQIEKRGVCGVKDATNSLRQEILYSIQCCRNLHKYIKYKTSKSPSSKLNNMHYITVVD